jgi:hypothetical protein
VWLEVGVERERERQKGDIGLKEKQIRDESRRQTSKTREKLKRELMGLKCESRNKVREKDKKTNWFQMRLIR